jgi:4a-hydroxytetrahydrobiopterin dehydratase
MAVSELAKKRCVPCKSGTPPLTGKPLQDLLGQLGNDWKVVDAHHLEKEYRFKDFVSALAFTNRVGGIAEEQGHHPDIHLSWGKVRLTIWTHSINGLSESDFILGARADAAL